MNIDELVEQYDNDLFYEKHLKNENIRVMTIWKKICKDNQILNKAMQIVKTKDNRNFFFAPTIVEYMIRYYNYIDSEIYKKLIDLICSNTDLSRISNNNTNSFLLMILWNKDLTLNQKQKDFIVNELINRNLENKDDIYATFWDSFLSNNLYLRNKNEFNKIINRDIKETFYIPIQKDEDLRYYVLKSSQFSLDEKRILVYKIFKNDEDYKNAIIDWEYNILTFEESLLHLGESVLDMNDLYFSSLETIENKIGKEKSKYLLNNISFVRLMHELRPVIFNDNDFPHINSLY